MKKLRIITSLMFSFIVVINSLDNPFIFFLSNQSLILDYENCLAKGEMGVKQFSDCDTESNYDNQQVCCYIYGTNLDGTLYRGCMVMNTTLFLNKTFSYTSSSISGTVVCTKDFNFSYYYKNPLIFYLFLFIILL